jgi:hypothetical protein
MDEENPSNIDMDEANYNDKLNTKTDTYFNKKSKIVKLNTIKSFSTKKESLKIKDIEGNYNLYDKLIFEPIYSQIHKNMKEYAEEIKTGKQLINSGKKIKREIFQYKYKKGNLLLNNYAKDDSKNKKLYNNLSIKKSFFLKTFSGNINNLYSENNKKRVMFRNLHLNEAINNNTDNSRLKFKSYTDRNKKNEDDKNSINDEELDTKLNFPEINKNSNLLFRNSENKLMSTNSLINLSQLNRTLTNTPKDKTISRTKTYYVEYDPKWYIKNKLIKTRFEKDTITNPLLQKKLIDDELVLLFDNMKLFQSKFIVNKTLNRDYEKLLSNKSKTVINILLEETIGLFIEISYLLLNNYSTDIEKYISNPIARKTKQSVKKVDNEKKEFKINITNIYESYIFLKVCYETYKIILNTKKDFYINKNNFEILFQYLDRARFDLSKICSELNILYQEPNQDDKKLIDRCMNRIKKNHIKIFNALKSEDKSNNKNSQFNSKSFSRTKFLKYFNNKYKSKIDCHQKFGLFNSGIDSFNYNGPKKLKLNEQQSVNVRINKAFGGNSRNLKLKHFPKFDINSRLVNNLMKYATNKFKNDIISERIRQRFYELNNEE